MEMKIIFKKTVFTLMTIFKEGFWNFIEVSGCIQERRRGRHDAKLQTKDVSLTMDPCFIILS
ncbi:hypothetical protein T02_313 [Trichinella nativa]|uniref:Uncharacterized protein n=1 Tax=Trichinella nativa TaxID=6335 RepID=A0A0V1KQW4_9BILA|nr:hypothetical protein T02_313 [Trichinella nativa]